MHLAPRLGRPLQQALQRSRLGQQVAALPQWRRTSNVCKGSTMFSGTSVNELEAWLVQNGVDTSQYGRQLAKTVADLLEEQSKSESILDVVDGRAQRIVRVLSMHIRNNRGQILYEDEQILPDGRSRRRNVTVSEKLIADESWKDAVPRAVREELGTVLPPDYEISVQEETYRQLEEYSASMSYPGLLTRYIFHRVNARVTGLPQGAFETREERPGGQLITRWVWRDADEVEAIVGRFPTSSTG
mmetsp:Transcript_22305/g.56751  ORF Transcript_22305/g.56751 Transcript_22305/m.56751 type:complete len:244 (-) Transcript_22305:867-1598(-)